MKVTCEGSDLRLRGHHSVQEAVLEGVLRGLLVAAQAVAVADEHHPVEAAVVASRRREELLTQPPHQLAALDEPPPDPAAEPLEVVVVAVHPPQVRVLELSGEPPQGEGRLDHRDVLDLRAGRLDRVLDRGDVAPGEVPHRHHPHPPLRQQVAHQRRVHLALVFTPLRELAAQLGVPGAGLVEVPAQGLLEVAAGARDDALLTERDPQQHADAEREEHGHERDRVVARGEQGAV
jgi:hypothetical protein